jgi:RimJ/RimL family protein N-acetyltransferase
MARAELEPLYALRLRTPRLELRLPRNPEVAALAHVARAGVHPPETMPFRVAWTDAADEPGFVERVVEYHLGLRDAWSPAGWRLEVAVWADGELAGVQGISAQDFATARTVETGSWLGRRFQGRGYGTEMRAAVLELAFAGLGATLARSGMLEGNVASERVSAKLGYEPAGEGVAAPRGVPVRELEVELTRARWQSHRATPVEIEGLEPCLPLFGVAAGSQV